MAMGTALSRHGSLPSADASVYGDDESTFCRKKVYLARLPFVAIAWTWVSAYMSAHFFALS